MTSVASRHLPLQRAVTRTTASLPVVGAASSGAVWRVRWWTLRAQGRGRDVSALKGESMRGEEDETWANESDQKATHEPIRRLPRAQIERLDRATDVE